MYNQLNGLILVLFQNHQLFFTILFLYTITMLLVNQKTFKLFSNIYILIILLFVILYLYVSESLSFVFLIMESTALLFVFCIFLNFNVFKNTQIYKKMLIGLLFVNGFFFSGLFWVLEYVLVDEKQQSDFSYLYLMLFKYDHYLVFIIFFILITFLFISFFSLYRSFKTQNQFTTWSLNINNSKVLESGNFTKNFYAANKPFPIKSY